MGRDLLGREVATSPETLSTPPGLPDEGSPHWQVIHGILWTAHARQVKAETGMAYAMPPEACELRARLYRLANALCYGFWANPPAKDELRMYQAALADPKIAAAFVEHARRCCKEWFHRGPPAWTADPLKRLKEIGKVDPIARMRREANDWIREQAEAGKLKLATPAAKHATDTPGHPQYRSGPKGRLLA